MSSMDNDNAHCLILSRCLAVSYGFLSWHDMAKYIACIELLCSRKSHELLNHVNILLECDLKLGYKYIVKSYLFTAANRLTISLLINVGTYT